MSARARVILALLALTGAGITAAVFLGRPGIFVLDRTLTVHQEDRPEQVAFVPGKDWVLFGARYKPVAIFDLAAGTKRELFADPAHGEFTLSVDGVSAAIVMPGPELRIYELASGKVRQTFQCVPIGGRESMSWSPDGQWIALGQKGSVEVLDLKLGVTHTYSSGIRDDHVSSLAFSPDGRLLGVGTWGGVVSLWKTDSWTLSQEFDLGSDPKAGRNGMCSITFSRDGSLFAAGGGSVWSRGDDSDVSSGALRVWRAGDRTVVLSMELKEPAASLCFSPSGTMLAYSTWGRIHVVDLGTGNEIWSQRHVASGMYPIVAFGQDGRLITLDSRGPIRIWKRPP